METEIKIEHLSKSFDGKKVIDDVSFEIEKGDIYGVLGLSGAGKSTLVRCINSLETFEEGKIYFKDRLLCSPTVKASRDDKRMIGMIFQSFNLLDQKNCLENVMIGLEIHKVEKKKRKEIAMEALKRVGLDDKWDSYPSQLSGGQKQRVSIARCLALKPEVILSDEATSALDSENTKSVLSLLSSLNKNEGITIIMISHQLNTIEAICNKVCILDKAKIVENGNIDDVFLSPKADITKQLLYSNKIHTNLDEKKMLRILFDGNADEPILSEIVLNCNVLVNLVYADTKVKDGKIYGQTVIQKPIDEKDYKKVLQFLNFKSIKYEEVEL